MMLSTRLRACRRTGDRGAALVEAALILPILILLFSGMVEYGMAWRTSNSVADRVGNAALGLSRGYENRNADLQVLEQVRSVEGDLDQVRWVIVYRTTHADGRPPLACRWAAAWSTYIGPWGIDGNCNVYPGSSMAGLDASDFTDPDCVGDPDEAFCPSTRDAALQAGDRLGVEIRLKHSWLSGMLPGSGLTIADHAVAEPIA
jgi:hypothetical protein